MYVYIEYIASYYTGTHARQQTLQQIEFAAVFLHMSFYLNAESSLQSKMTVYKWHNAKFLKDTVCFHITCNEIQYIIE